MFSVNGLKLSNSVTFGNSYPKTEVKTGKNGDTDKTPKTEDVNKKFLDMQASFGRSQVHKNNFKELPEGDKAIISSSKCVSKYFTTYSGVYVTQAGDNHENPRSGFLKKGSRINDAFRDMLLVSPDLSVCSLDVLQTNNKIYKHLYVYDGTKCRIYYQDSNNRNDKNSFVLVDEQECKDNSAFKQYVLDSIIDSEDVVKSCSLYSAK